MQKCFDSQFKRKRSVTVREGWMVGDSMVVRADSWDSPPSHVEEG